MKKSVVPLEKLDQSKIHYEKFEKNFYFEHEDITALSQEKVSQILKDFDIKIKGKTIIQD